MREGRDRRRRRVVGALVPAVPFLWLAVFFVLPLGIVLKISLSDAATAQPPHLVSIATAVISAHQAHSRPGGPSRPNLVCSPV